MPKKKNKPPKSERKRLRQMEEEETMALMTEVSAKVFQWDRLKNRCLAPIRSFVEMAKRMPNATVHDEHTDNPYIFIDNGGKVLGVAHLDTVSNSEHFAVLPIQGDWWVMAAQLDDRLGVFLLLDVLRYLGMEYDILLTTGEESGRTSAKKFIAPEGKDWNWMFECDRMGTDVVRYKYDGLEWEKMLKSAGFGPVGHGSFTDICDLDNLGVAGFNMGVGYADYHGVWAKANMTDCAGQVAKLLKFYRLYSETKVEWAPKTVAAYTYPAGRGVDGYDGQPAWVGNRSFAVIDSDKIFKKDEWVRVKADGREVRITSEYPSISYLQGTRNRKWWATWPIKPEDRETTRGNRGGWAFSSYDEDELERIIPDPALIAPPGEAVEETLPLESREPLTIPARESALLQKLPRTITPHLDRGEVLAVRDGCEGLPDDINVEHGEDCIQARWAYEEWLFGESLSYGSTYLTGRIENMPFGYGDRVYTPYGAGEIECSSGCIVLTEDYQWWVRLKEPDRFGWYVHLIPENEISLIMGHDGNGQEPPPAQLALPPTDQVTAEIFNSIQDAANHANRSSDATFGD